MHALMFPTGSEKQVDCLTRTPLYVNFNGCANPPLNDIMSIRYRGVFLPRCRHRPCHWSLVVFEM